ncbi:MAG: flagellar biosynthesis anti-sigma factor FlgM [Syntrophales bacterium]
MKITDKGNTPISVIQQYQKNEDPKVAVYKQAPQPEANTEEKVSISKESRDAVLMRGIINNLPEVREDKVQELKAQIENGTYEVSSEDIAKKMISESLIDIFA